MVSSFHDEIYSVLEIAVTNGGTAIKEIYDKDDFKVFTKKGTQVKNEDAIHEISTNLKTEADEASHKAIANIVGERSYCGIPLIYEETDWDDVIQGTYISFDEMDGTGRFIKRQPGFMVLAQYVENGIPVIGMNFDPLTNELFSAKKDCGSYLQEKKLQLPTNMSLDSAKLIVPGRIKERIENKQYWDFLKNAFEGRVSAGLGTGSRMSGILQGKYDAFVNAGSEQLHIWDLGMVLNILEAGGKVTRKDGSLIDYAQPGIIDDVVCSANEKLHYELLDFIEKYNL